MARHVSIRSAVWWARLVARMVETWHLFMFLCRALGMFVDNILLWQDGKLIALSESAALAFAAAKVELSHYMQWIGWSTNL